MTHIYITKYALTIGVDEADAEISGGCAVVRKGSRPDQYLDQYFHEGEWHITKTAAVAKAEDMRKRKIASLQRSIAKMEKLTFGEPVA